ncbi:MAG: winged helix-turn-helix domain-containing protein [Candidatus Altiarchaeota archaeon]
MADVLIKDGVLHKLWVTSDEVHDFEPIVKYHVKDIFGVDCEYFQKQKLKSLADNRSIPDGFVIDYKNQMWYIVELKLLCDDAVKRIPGQIISYKNAVKSIGTKKQIYDSIRSQISKPPAFLYDLIFDKNPSIVIIINSLDGELGEQFEENVNGADKNAKILVFKTFAPESTDPRKIHCHVFEPMHSTSPFKTKKTTSTELASTPELKRMKRGEITTQLTYRMPILETLLEMGGRGKTKEVLDSIGVKMKGILKAVDYTKQPSGFDIRWRNTAAWERQQMTTDGLLKSSKESGRGFWEISDTGRRYYDENKPHK